MQSHSPCTKFVCDFIKFLKRKCKKLEVRMKFFYYFSSMNCELFLLDCEDKIKFQKNVENIHICKITESQLKEIN